MNFEGFRHLLLRVAKEWYDEAWLEHRADFKGIKEYLQVSPFTAKDTPENEDAYERLMDVRLRLEALSFEIDQSKAEYMGFVEQTMENPHLMERVTRGLTTEERHLVELELMILEQVADLEPGAPGGGNQWSRVKPLVVSLPNGTTRTLTIQQEPQKRYWFAMCPVSCKIGEVKLCAGCKTIGYIGKDEQKEDWPEHKKLCKVLKTARGKSQHWLCNNTPGEMRKILVRELGEAEAAKQFVVDITDYPRVCVACQQGKRQDLLKDCKKCFGVAYCCPPAEVERAHPEATCTAMRICAEDYRHEMKVGHQVQNYAPKVMTKYSPLTGESEQLFADQISSLVSNKLSGYQDSELRYLTFLYACPLTVLFGAERAGEEWIGSRESLTVHLVGARRAELRHLQGWEMVACRLPKLKRLKLVFVGDEAVTSRDMPEEFSFKGKDLQAERKGLDIVYSFPPPMLYQEYAKKKTFVKPDLVAALDCGFKFYEAWKDAIKVFVSFPKCPLVFTEFNEGDMEDNLRIVEGVAAATDKKLELCCPPQRNPFSSTKPARCSDKTGNYRPFSVVYTNDYICVVKPKT